VATISYYLDEETANTLAEAAVAESGEEQSRPSRPEIEITVSDEAGEVIRTLTGPAAAGLNTINWDLRTTKPGPAAMSPSKRAEAMKMGQRAMVVRDSLVTEGWNEMMVGRLTGLFTGETNPMDLYRAYMGGGPVAEPEAFVERPGESMGGSPFGGFTEIQVIAELVMPGAGMSGLMRQFGGEASRPAPLAEPGVYTLTLTVGDRSFTQPITVERVGSFVGQATPFEASRER
jgi:hypothetical protein